MPVGFMHPAIGPYIARGIIQNVDRSRGPLDFQVRFIEPIGNTLWHELRHYPQYLYAKRLVLHVREGEDEPYGYTLEWLNE